ncbi:unnamed protein product [Pipistrellus nathusii]|uniref:Uncharacterized protein n=1 Tax=Pipistrellus nathusii TaxID=59473 RepID=A0ABP0AAC3_PIPNA
MRQRPRLVTLSGCGQSSEASCLHSNLPQRGFSFSALWLEKALLQAPGGVCRQGPGQWGNCVLSKSLRGPHRHGAEAPPARGKSRPGAAGRGPDLRHTVPAEYELQSTLTSSFLSSRWPSNEAPHQTLWWGLKPGCVAAFSPPLPRAGQVAL